MPEEITPFTIEDLKAGREADTSRRFVYGKLLPLGVAYKAWATESEPSRDIDYAEYVKLGARRAGQFVVFTVDGRELNPNLKFPYTRKEPRGFPIWRQVVYPSILDVIGLGEQSFQEFVRRAGESAWYVEAELVLTGRQYTYTDSETGQARTRDQDTFKFLRMTKDKEECVRWYTERFKHAPGEGKPEEAIPQTVLETAASTFAFVKGDLPKFQLFMEGSEETKKYAAELLHLAAQGKLKAAA